MTRTCKASRDRVQRVACVICHGVARHRANEEQECGIGVLGVSPGSRVSEDWDGSSAEFRRVLKVENKGKSVNVSKCYLSGEV